MRSWLTCLALLTLLTTAACGADEGPSEDGGQPRPMADDGGAGRAPLEVEPVPVEDRARFALDRILRGPERSAAALLIRNLHPTSLAMAERDLIDMAPQALALLDDDALIERLTRGQATEINAWLGVMSVLMAIPQKPATLVVRWTEPALDRPKEISLLRRAVRTLTTVQDPVAAPTILRFLEAAPGDRLIAPKAFASLTILGSPWRERAVAAALRHGGPYFWKKIPEVLAIQEERGHVDPKQTSTLTWAAHWMEGSGPRTPGSLPREQKQAWSSLRVWLDPQVPRTTRTGADQAAYRVLAYGLLPVETAYGAGWFTCDTARAGFVPASTLFFTGREPAAEARCLLATRGHAPFLASRDAEDTETYKAIDASVYYAAHHCVDADTEGDRREENLREFVEKLERAIEGGSPGVDGVPLPSELTRLIGGLPDPRTPRIRAVVIRVLKELRPVANWRSVIYVAHATLVPQAPPTDEDLALMESLALGGTEEDRGVALDLIRRSRIADYIPFVERMLDEGLLSDPSVLWRTLMFLYSTSPGVEPRKMFGFVERVEQWIRATVEPERGAARAAALAAGLLDFDDPGAEAYARFLRGPNRPAYAQALAGRKAVLPESVVRAIVEPLGAQTSAAEMRAYMEIAWRLFPAGAAGELAALARAATEPTRPLVEAALVRVTNRGPRRAR